MAYQLNEDQERWLQALESGKFSQQTGVLRGYDGYCCLGVAVKVLTPRSRFLKPEAARNLLPCSRVMRRLLLRGNCGELVEYWGDASCLTTANDNGKTFAEIAAYIRANPENVFLPQEDE